MKFGLPFLNKLLALGEKGCCEVASNAMTCEQETHQVDLHES